MAVNKNFVVKNGLEVNDNLLVADIDTQKVGIGTSVASYELHVLGGIGATDVKVTGITSLSGSLIVGADEANSDVTVWGNTKTTGITTLASAGGITTTGGDLYIGGDLYVLDDVVYDEVNGRNLNISGVATFGNDINIHGPAGVTSIRWDASQLHLEFLDESKATFGTNNDLKISHTYDLKDQNDSEGNSVVDGWTSYIEEAGTGGLVFKSNGNSGEGAYQFFDTSWRPILRLFSGANARSVLYHAGLDRFETTAIGATVHGSLGILTDLTVGGNLSVTGDIVYDEVRGRNINISGLSTFDGLSYFGSNVGVGTTNPAIAADSNNTNILNAGIVTANYIYGDVSGATGVTTSIIAAIGVSSEGTFVGTAATIINFASSNTTAWNIENSGGGIATATITPGASLGMVIALGG